jgi:hypothetical protein
MSKKRKHLSEVPRAPCQIDDLSDLPYVPEPPLPAKSFAMYIVGAPGSGKSNLWQAMLVSKNPLYYRGLFDRIELVSGSLGTLADKVTDQLPSDQQYPYLNDDLLVEILENMKKDPENCPNRNANTLLVLDDVIKDITRTKDLSKVFLNRRHVTHSHSKEGNGGLAIMVTSQKYNLLPLEFRGACDHVILFRTSNAKELRAITDELMQDLSPEQQRELMKDGWSKRYSFITVKLCEPTESRYYIKFTPWKVYEEPG